MISRVWTNHRVGDSHRDVPVTYSQKYHKAPSLTADNTLDGERRLLTVGNIPAII